MEQNINENNNIFYNLVVGNIFTANKLNEFIESMIVDKSNGTIIFTGKEQDAINFLNEKGSAFSTIKIKSTNLILPGFVDSHCHPFLGGMNMESADLSECYSTEMIKENLLKYISENPDKKFIFGYGFDNITFDKSSPAHFKVLDEVSTEIPIILIRFDCHAYWCNSAILKIANINNQTQNPEGGIVERDFQGNITGILHDSAMSLLKPHFPKLSDEEKLTCLQSTLEYYLSFGITSFMDAAVSPKHYKVYKQLYTSEISSMMPRCSLSMCAKNLFLDREVQSDEEVEEPVHPNESFKKLEKFFSSNRIEKWELTDYKFRVNAVKLFIDGVFESGTAMFSKCKCHNNQENTEEIKTYTYTKEELQTIIGYLYKNDIQIHCHCIGDLAAKMVIDSIESASLKKGYNTTNQRDYKDYLAHLQLLGEEEINRMKNLNIAGNMSPYWFKEDKFSETLHKLIGDDRLNDIYPINNLLNKSVTVGFGSDWPVSTLSPLEGIEVAVTHRHLGMSDDKPSYNIEHIISIEQAIQCYTIKSAQILGLDNHVGSLEVGKKADFIILDQNVFKKEPWMIHRVKVDSTYINGKEVYVRKD
jgi:predicted amidohydrolase YtcJ